jgi:uncharacterized protein (DUF885 family)
MLLPAITRANGGDADAELKAALDSLAGMDDAKAKLARLAGFDPRTLSASARIDLETVRAGLGIDIQLTTRFPFGKIGRTPYTLSPNVGAWRDVGQVKEVAALVRHIDAETEQVEVEAAHGVILPRPFFDSTLANVSKAAASAPAEIARALNQQAALLATLKTRAPDEPGVGRLPGGVDYFALLLQRSLGIRINAVEAHYRLSDKAHQLGVRADGVLRRLGLNQGSVGERINATFNDPRFLYSDDDAGRNRAVADMNAWLDRVRPRLPVLFNPLPSHCLNVAARRMNSDEEAAGKAGYRTLPTRDTAGAYFVDLVRIGERPSWTLGAVVHHELLPGHMIQMPMEADAGAHPLRLEYLPAFAEGWAIYAEQLMADDGAFAGDDYALLGHLHWLLFRIGRGLADTGIHVKHHSLTQTVNQLAALQGPAAYFAPVAQDIERICINPAIRAAEALCWLGLAEAGLSAKTQGYASLRNFHHSVLVNGRKPPAGWQFVSRQDDASSLAR